jgi:hypothetical protein
MQRGSHSLLVTSLALWLMGILEIAQTIYSSILRHIARGVLKVEYCAYSCDNISKPLDKACLRNIVSDVTKGNKKLSNLDSLVAIFKV